jgi:hypothetical protein
MRERIILTIVVVACLSAVLFHIRQSYKDFVPKEILNEILH